MPQELVCNNDNDAPTHFCGGCLLKKEPIYIQALALQMPDSMDAKIELTTIYYQIYC